MKTRRYETLMLFDAELPQEELEGILNKLKGIMEDMGGKIVNIDDWGRRRLAYPVMKKMYGQYILFDFMGTAELNAEIERNIGIEERIYKHMTMVLDKNFTEEKYQAELERMKSEKARLEAEKAQREAERAKREAGAYDEDAELDEETPEDEPYEDDEDAFDESSEE